MIPAEHLIGGLAEGQQQGHGTATDRILQAISAGEPTLGRLELQPSHREGTLEPLGLAPPGMLQQQLLDAQLQFPRQEGLGEVVVGTHLEAADAIGRRPQG